MTEGRAHGTGGSAETPDLPAHPGALPPPSGQGLPEPPEAAKVVFGDRLDLARRYAEHLADTGISHGLLGPREVPRLWDRHVLNCAVIAEVIPDAGSVVDIGSGAGLPGICLAIARPDLSVTLVEPMERRTAWLAAVCADLGLENVTIERARAEEVHDRLSADVVTARAVAALDKLARWCLPLVLPGGRLVAMKGSSAEREILEAAGTVRRLGGRAPSVHLCGVDVLHPPTTVVIIEKPAARDSKPRPPHRSRRSHT